MKKSAMYEQAALSVMKNNIIPDTQKLEIIRELLDAENTAKILEKIEERKEKSNEH